ncbi:Na+/H+ antiporter subunit E [Alkalicoccus urumqiensis]|uniref:Na+/H+ antiporter subunit E n=1 Tax=Alkalicoccus urumqiensis TaxID=1548213 RepID=A0A2P6MFP7_ALKUR|nr:Na+/H+ antiporter subunit E [Alkalicoccus urumqiensis]PRO65070.1 Na+/H+ antiporter subunit E [Alkalicoccus urumqiensis]
MQFQILINIVIAFIWMFLQNDFSGVTFIIGYIVGLLMLFFLRRFLRFDFYFRRVWAFIKLMALFAYKLVEANWDVIKIILRPKLDIEPGIIAVPTKLKSDWERTLLANLISLTPGTLTMNFSEDGSTLFIHAIHVPDKEKAIKEIHDTFEKAIREVTE